MTTTTQLTGRDRVNRMFDRRDQDRVPRHESVWSDTLERWRREGFTGSLIDFIDGDFHGVGWSWPGIYPDEVVLEEDEHTRVKRDIHGRVARWWKARMGTPEHIRFECDSRAKWEQTCKPMFLERGCQVNPEALQASYRSGIQSRRWLHLTGVEPFEITRALIGDEATAYAMALEPEWIVDIAKTYTDRILADYQHCLDAGMHFDGLWTYGDMAYNHATFCSPAMYRELIWPQHKRLADFAHAHGMKFIYHTDGDVNGVIDLYLDAGFDCLQPLEAKANMDVRKLCPKYGDRLAFFGNIDIMVMATNDREKIEHEVRTKLEAGKATRGYAYHSDHSVPPSVSWETYQYIIGLVNRYGRYE